MSMAAGWYVQLTNQDWHSSKGMVQSSELLVETRMCGELSDGWSSALGSIDMKSPRNESMGSLPQETTSAETVSTANPTHLCQLTIV